MPESLPAGTYYKYTKTFADYLASDGWGLQVTLAGAGLLQQSGVQNGDGFDVVLGAVGTAGLAPGTYQWVERVQNASEVYDAGRGTIVILPDVDNAAAGELQTWEEKTLEVVNLALTGQLTDGIANYQIAGRAVSRIPMLELLSLRDKLQTAVNLQKSGRASRTTLIQFTGAGFDR